jgi:hypothetical protein
MSKHSRAKPENQQAMPKPDNETVKKATDHITALAALYQSESPSSAGRSAHTT